MLNSPLEPALTPTRGSSYSAQVATIPIVFFGRLEERKGLCTFLDAVRMLSPDEWGRLHITFMGKVVALYSEALCHLNSREYIEQVLGTDVSYDICSSLFSQEAIQRVREIQPIVCLTSPQENFPNSALEMGQLPVGLVVSKTGGFEETLALVKRTEGVYWFTPGDAVTLAAALREAIAHYPKTYPVATRTELEQVNAALLEQKLQHIERAFQSARSTPIATAPITIGLVCPTLTPPLLETLTSIEAQNNALQHTLVLHGDPSAEAEAKVLEQVQTRFPGVRLMSLGLSVNGGAAWNQVRSLMTGDYCMVLEPGWVLLPGALDALMAAVQRSQASIVACPRWNQAETETMVTFGGGALPTLIRSQQKGNLPVLVSRSFWERYPLPEVRDLEISGWALLSGAIATGATPICYPYPLVQSHQSDQGASGLASPRQQYYLRQHLAQIPPADWSPRQVYMVLTALQHLSETSQQASFAAQQKLLEQHTEERLAESQQRLHEVQLKVHRTHKRLNKATADLEAAQARLEAYEGSKFWKLHQTWQRLKQSLKRGEH